VNPASHLIQRVLGLGPPLTRDLLVEHDLRVPMPDGIELLADRWAPRAGGDGLPLALLRSPYGRGSLIGAGTTAPLEADVETIGEVSAEIWFRSSLAHADVFVRLCDVDPRGRSWNVCDGLLSLSGADEITRAVVGLWPTAYRFGRGHRIACSLPTNRCTTTPSAPRRSSFRSALWYRIFAARKGQKINHGHPERTRNSASSAMTARNRDNSKKPAVRVHASRCYAASRDRTIRRLAASIAPRPASSRTAAGSRTARSPEGAKAGTRAGCRSSFQPARQTEAV
jgi:predicted acyl esterase